MGQSTRTVEVQVGTRQRTHTAGVRTRPVPEVRAEWAGGDHLPSSAQTLPVLGFLAGPAHLLPLCAAGAVWLFVFTNRQKNSTDLPQGKSETLKRKK